MLGGICLLAVWAATARTSETRELKFPDNISLGALWIIEDVNCFTCGNGEELVGEARGYVRVRLPAEHWYVKLVVSQSAVRHLSALQRLDAGAIEAVSFAGTTVKDADLIAISSLRIRDLDLSDTAVDGTGLAHLKNRAAWLSVSLRASRHLDANAINKLAGHNHISINLWRSNLDDRQYICGLQKRMCDAIKPERCYIRIHGSQDCADHLTRPREFRP